MTETITDTQLSFAQEIAKNFHDLSCGVYESSDKKYRIDIHEKLFQPPNSDKKETFTVSRISHKTGRIDLNKKMLVGSPENYILVSILWCWFKCPVRFTSKKEAPLIGKVGDIEADQSTCLYLLGKKLMPAKDIALAFVKMLKITPTDSNLERMRKIDAGLRSEQKEVNTQ